MPHRPQAEPVGDPWRAVVVTLFPEAFPGALGLSLVGQALAAGLWSLDTVPLREFGIGRHRAVDDTPAGGGPGMVLRADVVAAAIDRARETAPALPAIYLSPRGRPLTQERVAALAAGPGLVLLAGRFEGVDQRVLEARGLEEVSIGDYVLSGGELPAMVLIDACVRLLPGVIGKLASTASESFEDGLLEYPHYTKPREWEGRGTPDILLSGDHAAVDAWRRTEAERLTRERRPDLLARRDANIEQPAMGAEPERMHLAPDAAAAHTAAAGRFETIVPCLRRAVPATADIRHIGATAVPGCLTKGDLDIVVRVAASDFEPAVAALGAMFAPNTGSARTETFASFVDPSATPHLGVQLTTVGGPFDDFHVFTDALLADAGLVARYNDLKRAFDGRSMDAYRAAKSAFVADALSPRSAPD